MTDVEVLEPVEEEVDEAESHDAPPLRHGAFVVVLEDDSHRRALVEDVER